MSKRQISSTAVNIEYEPGAYRQVSNAAGNIEYLPGAYRQTSSTAANIEYLPGAYRQFSNVALLVEYTPCLSTIDAGYAEYEFYVAKLTVLKNQYGRTHIDLQALSCTSPDYLEALKQLYIREVKAAISDYIGFAYDPEVV
jgi:hypothetical protein